MERSSRELNLQYCMSCLAPCAPLSTHACHAAGAESRAPITLLSTAIHVLQSCEADHGRTAISKIARIISHHLRLGLSYR